MGGVNLETKVRCPKVARYFRTILAPTQSWRSSPVPEPLGRETDSPPPPTPKLTMSGVIPLLPPYFTITTYKRAAIPLFISTMLRYHNWHCATSRKVAGSIPDGVIGIFHRHNPSGRTMALGLSQPLIEMRTRNISWRINAAGA